MKSSKTLQLKGIEYLDLFTAAGLKQLDSQFFTYLHALDPTATHQLLAYREKQSTLNPVQTSELLITCSIYLEQFLATLFAIEETVAISQVKTIEYNPIAIFKKYFVLRRAKKELTRDIPFAPFNELN